jgi:beta-N-acetylglucosaminidase
MLSKKGGGSMKNKTKLFYLVLFVIAFIPVVVNGKTVTTGEVTAENNLRIRNGPGTGYTQIGSAAYKSTVTIISDASSGNGCNDKWIKIISSTNVEGYVCSTYIKNIKTTEVVEDTNVTAQGEKMAKMTDAEFETYLTSQGFPESYKVKLRALHKLHPTWIFKGIKTRYNWTESLNSQDSSGTSLMNVNTSLAASGYEGYLSVAEADYDHDKDKFKAHDGTYWFQANRQTIAYYLDPRNFLDEKKIFMFEELFYYPSYQTLNVVKATLSSDFLKQYAQYFMDAATSSKVSPVYLAALVKQEVGTTNTNICTNGKAGVLSDGVNYNGYYNFFNIGASSSSNPKLKSLQYAKSAGWNTQKKAIVNGASIISNYYVNCGQYTSYFQKFNLAATATKGTWHQYTTNISALVSPATSTYNAYYNNGLIEKDFVFAIPIYSGIPSSTSLPKLGNPNNWLKTLKVNGSVVTNFDNDTLKYTVNVPYSETVKIDATAINANAKITGTGTKNLTGDTTTLNVVVTAQNGSVKTYVLTIKRAKKVEEPATNNTTNQDVTPTTNDNTNNTTPENTNNTNTNNNDTNTNTNTNNNTNTSDVKIDDVLKASGYNYNSNYLTKVTFGTSVSSLTNNFTKKYPTITVNVYNKNNKTKSSGTIVTGDKVTISSNGTSKTLEVVIYGDTSGDGKISGIDLLNTQKHILGKTKLKGAYLKAADTNKDGKVSGIDLLNMQKHILKKLVISQN